MKPRVILDSQKFRLTLDRLCFELIENHQDFSKTALIGVQPRGVHLARRIFSRLAEIAPGHFAKYGELDIAFYRDDFRRRKKTIVPKTTSINFSIEAAKIVLIDDVFYTGRTIRSAMDALLDFGRPEKIELLSLIDRRFSRQVPVQPDYIGKTVDSVNSELVRVEWEETEGQDMVWILSANSKK